MPVVTVPGANGTIVFIPFTTVGDNAAYATSLLSGVYAAFNNGTVNVLTSSSGATTAPVSGDVNEFLVDSSAPVIAPTGYDDIFVSSLAGATVFDNSDAGQLVIMGEGGGTSFFSSSGSGTIVAGGGQNTLGLGSGDWTVSTSGDGTLLFAGTGSDTIFSQGPDTIIGGGGTDILFGSMQGGDLIFGGSGDMTYIGAGGSDTVVAGSGSFTGFAGTSSSDYFVGAGAFALVGGTGTSVVVADSSSGTADLFGAAGGTIDLFGDNASNILVAGSGNETLNAAGSSGMNTFYAGTGDDSLGGGTGANLFVFGESSTPANDIVSGYSSSDSIYLSDSMTYTLGNDSAGDQTLSLSDGTTVTFQGVSSIDPSHISG